MNLLEIMSSDLPKICSTLDTILPDGVPLTGIPKNIGRTAGPLIFVF